MLSNYTGSDWLYIYINIRHTAVVTVTVQNIRLPRRDALESATGLYNQVEEKLHTLVMRSNESLQHLHFLFRLRETEAKISTVQFLC